MFVEIEDFEKGWVGLTLGLKTEEIDSLIERLQQLRKNPSGHFHPTSDYEGEGGVGDIEIYIDDTAPVNLRLG